MANISNIAVKTNSSQPNGIMMGKLVNTSGILSNFGSSAWFELLDGKVNNSTFVIKFTTPSTVATARQDIIHAQAWEELALNASGDIVAYNFDTATDVTILTGYAVSTTYWIKIVRSGTTRTYYKSTNGTSYTQAASFTDTVASVSGHSSNFTIGNCSVLRLRDRGFGGTVDLTGCYREVNGTKVWEGTSDYALQRIGGKPFSGLWVAKNRTLANAVTLISNATVTYDISDYIPNDGYAYEVLIYGQIATQGVNGYIATIDVYESGHSSNYLRICRTNTRNTTYARTCGAGTLPLINGNNRLIVFRNAGNYSGNAYLYLRGYRRLPKTGSSLTKISYNNTSYNLAGDQFDGQWVKKYKSVTTEIAAGGSVTFDTSSYLPNDSGQYEVLLNMRGQTVATAGSNVFLQLVSNSWNTNRTTITAIRALTANAYSSRQCLKFPVYSGSNITVYQGDTSYATGASCYLQLAGYRRVGRNINEATIPTANPKLTIFPNPTDATVSFSTGTVSGNSCTVAKGTSVTYTVSKSGYNSVSGTITVNQNESLPVFISQYTADQVLYESSTGGASTTLTIKEAGRYQVICVGGGGGGADYLKQQSGRYISSVGSGGSGSGFNVIFSLSAGDYDIKVGAGGAYKRQSTAQATSGGDSQFGTSYARGGGGGKAASGNAGTAGTAGAAPTLTYTRRVTTLNSAGNAGTGTANTSKSYSVSGGAAVYSSYGKGGNGATSSASTAGTAGYVKVVYIGP